MTAAQDLWTVFQQQGLMNCSLPRQHANPKSVLHDGPAALAAFCPSRVLEILSGWQRGQQQAELYALRAVVKDRKMWHRKCDRNKNNTWDRGEQVIKKGGWGGKKRINGSSLALIRWLLLNDRPNWAEINRWLQASVWNSASMHFNVCIHYNISALNKMISNRMKYN